MGKSVTCTFAVHTQVGEQEYITGAMSIKEGLTNLKSEIQYAKQNWTLVPTKAYLWPQTARGRNLCRGYDYIEILPNGKTNYKNIEIPIYQSQF